MILIYILFILGLIAIVKGGDLFVDSAIVIAKKTGIPEIVIGATLVSLATTLPETTVSVTAALEGYTTMSFGNAIGSIICNTGLILGLISTISPFRVYKKVFNTKAIILIISLITMMTLSLNRVIDKADSIILILILIVYMYADYLNVSRNKTRNKIEEIYINEGKFKAYTKLAFKFIIGIVLIVLGSNLLIENGVKIAGYIGIPQSVISLTVIALGTSLPELVSCLTAIRKKHHELTVGNILGANILNICLVIGASSFIKDIPILGQNMIIDLPVMIFIILILIIPTYITNKLHRIQGILMLTIYIGYISMLYTLYMPK